MVFRISSSGSVPGGESKGSSYLSRPQGFKYLNLPVWASWGVAVTCSVTWAAWGLWAFPGAYGPHRVFEMVLAG